MVFSPEALATAMTGGTLHYPREKSPHRGAPTIEELNDRKCFYKYIYYYQPYFIYIIINAVFFMRSYFSFGKIFRIKMFS